MRALILEHNGRPTVWRVQDVPVTTPGPGQVLLRVAACGFCHHDKLLLDGKLRRGVRPGVIPGHEIAGVVADAGRGVVGFKPGDAAVSLLTDVCGACDRCRAGREHRCRQGLGIGHGQDGGFAEYVCLNAASLVKLPPGVDITEAALLACPIGVALRALREAAQLRAGETLLVTGAGGGLGAHALQAGAALGARTLAVTGSPAKAEALRTLGAAEVLDAAGELDFSELALALTGDAGADVVLDTVGSPLFPSTLRSLAQFGRWVALGEVTGQLVPLNLAELIFRDARLLGASGVSRASLEQALAMVESGRIRPLVSQRLPLERVGEALGLLERRVPLGRIVITP